MRTVYFTHPSCHAHAHPGWHPECPARLAAIEDHLRATGMLGRMLVCRDAPAATLTQLRRVHDAVYLGHVGKMAPTSPGYVALDPDTAMNDHSLDAALHAAGAAVEGVNRVVAGKADNAFCAVRPPGHHATRGQAMGFCIFNNVAVATAHALDAHGLARVAVVDFDVHHGNGTEDIFRGDARVLLCSTFRHPFYPHCGADTVSDNVVNVPLPVGTDGTAYRRAFASRVVPALDAFRPQLIMVSAGFDAHRDDPLGGFALVDDDYAWITHEIMCIADRHADGRVVAVLEGGYALSALGGAVAAHLGAMMER